MFCCGLRIYCHKQGVVPAQEHPISSPLHTAGKSVLVGWCLVLWRYERRLPYRRNLADVAQSFHEKRIFLCGLQIIVKLQPHKQSGIDAQRRFKQECR